MNDWHIGKRHAQRTPTAKPSEETKRHIHELAHVGTSESLPRHAAHRERSIPKVISAQAAQEPPDE